MIRHFLYIFIVGIFLNNCKGKADLSKESVLLVLSKKGDVVLFRDKKDTPIQSGSFVISGDTIQTGETSSVDLEFPNGALLRIKEKSTVTVNSILLGESSSVEIGLNSGSLFAKIKNKLKEKESFRVKTPTMIAGVRGTEFSVSEQELPKIMVLEGEVSTEKQNSEISSVSAGKKAEGEALIISDLSPEEKKELESDSIALIPPTVEFKENAQKLYFEFKETQKNLIDEQKNRNQDDLMDQKESNQNNFFDSQKQQNQENLNTQKLENLGNLNNQKDSDKSNLSDQKESGKKESTELKTKGKENLSGVKTQAELEKEKINSTKNALEAIKNQNSMEGVKPKK